MLAAMTHASERQAINADQLPLILGQAVSSQVGVRLRRRAGAKASFLGVLVDQVHDVLILRTQEGAPRADELSGAELSAVATICGAEYEFSTTCLPDQAAEPGTIRLAMPNAMFLLERRRTARRTLRRGLNALLTPHVTASATSAESEGPVTAVILNISQHGLACRLPAGQTRVLSVDDLLLARFSLGTSTQTFEFTGRIVSITEGGTPEQMVLGIEFIDGGTSHAQEALGAALADGLDA